MSDSPEIFFHVGLGKVASTYLQYRFFPHLQGIHYIQRTRYRQAKKIIARGEHARYLVSREFDQQLPEEIAWFAADYPQARPIILLRRHDSWIASQYRRYVKNGGPRSFSEFLDLDRDQGVWPRDDLYFFKKLLLLEQTFQHPPLVLFYEDLRADAFAFFDRIAAFTGAAYDREAISLDPVHRSYQPKQLRIMRRVSQRLFPNEPVWSDNERIRWWQRRGRLLACYLILYPAALFPERWAPQDELIPAAERERVRQFFSEDWEQCRDYARRGPYTN